MFINKDNRSSYNFKAPAIAGDADTSKEIFFPTQKAASAVFTENALSYNVEHDVTVLTFATPVAAASTLTLVAKDINVGARLICQFTFGGTKYDITVKTGEDTDATLAGVQSKTVGYELVWNGTKWIKIG